MIKHFTNIILFFLLSIFQIHAQEDKENPDTYESEILESVAENTEDEIDATSLTEELQYFLHHKIDINNASEKDFEKLHLLTPFQISSILEYRQIHGSFLTVFELNGVVGLPTTTLKILLPFIKVGSEKNIQNNKDQNEIGQMFMCNSTRTLEQQSGFADVSDSIKSSNPNKYYPGNPFRIKTKYRFEKGDSFQAGFSAEKDPGETWFSGSNKTFDFTSAYVQIQNLWKIKNLIVGDYHANFGQGLVLWNGFAAAKSAFTMNIKKQGEGFSRYTSYNENQFFRGVASSVQLDHFCISAFYSVHHIDANIVSVDSSGNTLEISSLQNTGSHALLNEISDEDALGEKTFGGNISFETGSFKAGTTIVQVNYDANFQKSQDLYKFYAFSGNNLICGSVNYLFRYRKIEVFGEAAKNSMNGIAFLNGLSFQIIPELSFALLYRNFEPEYFSPYAKAFSQNSQPSNEKGLYTGLELVPINNVKISAYADFFKYPYLKYRVSEPSAGSNYFIETTYEPSENISLSTRYSYLQKMEDGATSGPNPPVLANITLKRTRFQTAYKISPNIELRNRLELVYYGKENTPKQNGYLIYQDIVWKPEHIHFTLTARYAIFETGGYESSIYAYESEALFSYSIPAYSGKGTRFYLLLRYHPLKHMDLWIRYSSTIYSDREIISSGPGEIDGNTKSDVGAQMIIRF